MAVKVALGGYSLFSLAEASGKNRDYACISSYKSMPHLISSKDRFKIVK